MNRCFKMDMTSNGWSDFCRAFRLETQEHYSSRRWISLAEHVFLLVFHDRRIEDYAMSQLRVAEVSACDAELVLHCFVSDLPWRLDGVGEDCANVYISCEGKTLLSALSGEADTFLFRDADGSLILGWRRPPDDMSASLGHFLYRLLSNALRSMGTFMLHGGCVGLDGTGVFLCGRGGRGKSTLAAACLLDGFSYVSEDYCLVRRENGVLRAWPSYSTLNLSDEMLACMPVFSAHDLGYRGWSNKHFIDISSWRGQFAFGMPVKAALLPTITDRAEPRLDRISPAVPMAQLIDSTLRQTGGRSRPEIVKGLSAVLTELPTWELQLCPEPEKNAAYLREMIIKLK